MAKNCFKCIKMTLSVQERRKRREFFFGWRWKWMKGKISLPQIDDVTLEANNKRTWNNVVEYKRLLYFVLLACWKFPTTFKELMFGKWWPLLLYFIHRFRTKKFPVFLSFFFCASAFASCFKYRPAILDGEF